IVVPGFQITEGTSSNLEAIRTAIDRNIKLDVDYVSIKGEETSRTIWPFILYFWGNKWTVGAWCELRQGFRSFRVDLMKSAQLSGASFEPDDQRSLSAYIDYQRANNRD
ncbi:MAG: WYL domain-containing protein, partial [Pseudomonadales bacterium]|nr:WYL domain-containing protein [Pseudomonadales bacterium]